MIEKYSDEIMERIDARLGAGHRVKPFDLTNADDLKEALLVTVAAYRDYWHYGNTLDMLSEHFDESIEYCDTAAWLDLGHAPERVDDLTVEGFAVLGAAANVFDQLTARARENCAKIVKAVLAAPPAAQTAVLGQAYNIKPRDRDTRIGELFELLDEVEYHHAMPDNRDAFLELMKEQWASFISP